MICLSKGVKSFREQHRFVKRETDRLKRKRESFSTQLETASKRISGGEPQKSVETILQRANHAINAAIEEPDTSNIADELADTEAKDKKRNR